ncbi:hypothetical protein PSH28_18330 [Pseudomonas resinovorans]|uniref:hypothetical protein n=1 Tax=Metapseudomonas resinovorans TaxID=53412 RepID=UPI00237F6D6E|nr:hypothetical protein [Pseudomonas resinovorans]MDE3738566.1 hypothetical protein [Pseudomonas resinovorans]
MKKLSLKALVICAAPLSLTGCFQNAIDCDSREATSRISSDFRSNLENKLPPGAMDFISDISVTEIVTLKADTDAGLKSCEAKVVVRAKDSEEFAYQNIRYTNQTVKGGTEESRTIYDFVDTFSYIDKYVFDIVRDSYYQREAEQVGLKTSEQFLAYRDASNTITTSTSKKSEIVKRNSTLTADLQVLEPKVSSFISSVRSGKTATQPNDFIDTAPVTVDPQKSITRKLISKYIEFDTAVTNKSTKAIDSITLHAYVYLDNSNTPIREGVYASIKLESGLNPGETRVAKISIDPADHLINDFTETTAWKKAKTTTIVLRPVSMRNDEGREIEFDSRRSNFGIEETTKIGSITWDSYISALNELQINKKLLIELDNKITKAQQTLAKLKAS